MSPIISNDCPPTEAVRRELRGKFIATIAGMRSAAVEYGYHGVDNGGPRTWNSDILISQPLELLAHL